MMLMMMMMMMMMMNDDDDDDEDARFCGIPDWTRDMRVAHQSMWNRDFFTN